MPSYVVSGILLQAFENNDARRSHWLDSNVVNGTAYYYPFKYKLGYDGQPTPLEDYTVFRLAEEYLIRAEARAQQNDLAGAAADLNVIRSRAGLPDILPVDQASALAAIARERRVELFCEWGNRWLDLKRTKMADAVLSPIKPHWQSTDTLYPIPQTEIDANPNLTQNPGY